MLLTNILRYYNIKKTQCKRNKHIQNTITDQLRYHGSEWLRNSSWASGNMKTNGQNGMAKKNAENIWVNHGEPQRQ